MQLIFIGGCERSGTSLVQKILASHSRVAGGPELVFTGRIAELYRRMSASYPRAYSTRIEAFYDREELAETFRSLYTSLFSRIFEQKPGALYFSEKTPSNIFAAAQLLEIFPDSRFVHVIRDGRDVLASHRDVRQRFESNATARYNRKSFATRRVCARWNRAVAEHFRLVHHQELASRYVWIRYESLLRNPEETVAAMFDSLELDVEAKALTPEKITAEEMGIPIDGFWYTEKMYRRGFDPRRIGRWQQALPAVSQLIAGLMMAGNLRRLSYPVAEAYVLANRPLHGWLQRRSP